MSSVASPLVVGFGHLGIWGIILLLFLRAYACNGSIPGDIHSVFSRRNISLSPGHAMLSQISLLAGVPKKHEAYSRKGVSDGYEEGVCEVCGRRLAHWDLKRLGQVNLESTSPSKP
ncbi:hypothetical protein HOY80DRAFT_447161 [Tuber brumale]|nr:hypothetical protein HOY80DRAFT_447161 [Tuber brumale]